MAVNINSITLSDATGYLNRFGSYVQKKSKLRVQVNATSTNGIIDVFNYRITVNGDIYYSNDITTDVLKSSGTNTIIIQVFDNKGATASTTRTINVLEYNTPVIDVADVIRCNADGTANKAGTYAKVTINADCTNLSNNTYAYRIRYKKKKDEAYTTVAFTGTAATINESKIISGIDANSSYDFIIEAQDYLSLSAKIKSIGSKFSPFSVLANALGVAFGKKAEYENTFEVGYDNTFLSRYVYMNGNRKDNSQKRIWFNSPSDAQYPHNAYIYGGESASQFAIGLYDELNDLRILSYRDEDKTLVSEVDFFQIQGQDILTARNVNSGFSTVDPNDVVSTSLIIDIKNNYLDPFCTDSGWQTLSLTSDFAAYDGTATPKYRKIGKVVEVRGAVKPTKTLSSSNTEIVIGTLPSGFRPSGYLITHICQGSGGATWLLTIQTDGRVTAARYRNGDTFTNMETSHWLPFQVTFTV